MSIGGRRPGGAPGTGRAPAAPARCSANGPGAVRLGASVDAFTAQYRWTFPVDQGPKAPAAGARAVPVLTADGAPARWTRRPSDEATGLEIPPGGLVTPPVAAGEPAQVTLQLGARPARASAAAPRRLPGGVLDRAPGDGHGARRRASRSPPRWPATGRRPSSSPPPSPGPVTLRLVVPGAVIVPRALGGPSDVVGPLRAVRAEPALHHPRRGRPGHLGARHPAGATPARRRAARRSSRDRPARPL